MNTTNHLPLVKSIATKLCRYLPSTLDKDDLIQEGAVALVECLRSHDPARGAFSTYAYPFIRGAMLDIIRKQDWAPRLERQRNPDRLKKMVSMFEPNQNGSTLADDLADDDPTLKRFIHRDEIGYKLRNVNQPDRWLLQEYYMQGRTLAEIGLKLGVTKQRIEQRHAKIMKELRS